MRASVGAMILFTTSYLKFGYWGPVVSTVSACSLAMPGYESRCCLLIVSFLALILSGMLLSQDLLGILPIPLPCTVAFCPQPQMPLGTRTNIFPWNFPRKHVSTSPGPTVFVTLLLWQTTMTKETYRRMPFIGLFQRVRVRDIRTKTQQQGPMRAHTLIYK